MNTATVRASAAAALTVAIIVSTSASPASAIPWPGEPNESQPVHQMQAPCGSSISWGTRRLERIGTQFVRGDDLTGAGVAAPGWVPERQ